MQWQKQDQKKENVSFKSPRKKDGYSKESNDQQTSLQLERWSEKGRASRYNDCLRSKFTSLVLSVINRMQWQKQDQKKENVSFKSPRKKDGYSKESNDQQTGPKANSLHTMETLPRRTSFCCCSKPVSRMLAAALERLKDFAIGAIMESRKGQDQRQLPASLATTFPRICHRRKNLLALNRTL